MGGPGSGRKKGFAHEKKRITASGLKKKRSEMANRIGANLGDRRQDINSLRNSTNSLLSRIKKDPIYQQQVRAGEKQGIRNAKHDMIKIRATVKTGKNYYNLRSQNELPGFDRRKTW